MMEQLPIKSNTKIQETLTKMVQRITVAFIPSYRNQDSCARLYSTALHLYKKVISSYPLETVQATGFAMNLANYLHNFRFDYRGAQWIYSRILDERIETHGNEFKAFDALLFYNLAVSEQNSFFDARRYYLKALSIYNRVHGKRSEDALWVLANLSFLYSKFGKFRRSLSVGEIVKSEYENQGDKHSSHYASLLISLANVLREMGQIEKAKSYFHVAAEICTSIYDDGHPDVLLAKSNLADIEVSLGNYEDAFELYYEVQGGYEQLYPNGHPDTAITLMNISWLYEDLNLLDTAIEFGADALNLLTKIGLSEHYDASTAHDNIAMLYREFQNYQLSIKHMCQAIRIRRRLIGENHIAVAVLFQNLGIILHDLGKLSFAERLYNKAYEINLKHSNESEGLIVILDNMGGLALDKGKTEEAITYRRQSLRLAIKIYGTDTKSTASSLNNLALTYLSAKKYRTAFKLFQKLEELITNLDPLVAEAQEPEMYNNIAMIKQEQGDYNSAAHYFEKAIYKAQQTIGEFHTGYADVLCNQGINFIYLKSKKRGLECINEAYQIRLSIFGKRHPDTKYTERLLHDLNNDHPPTKIRQRPQ